MKYKVNQPAEEPSASEEVREIVKKSKCTLSDEMVSLLVRQLGHELYNHNLYRSFALFFGTQGLVRLEEYYILRAEEEKTHHDGVYQYLSDCDASIIYPAIPEIEEKWEDRVQPFELTVEAEIKTTMLINEIVDCALEEKDGATFKWVDKLVIEQVEEEMTSRTALDIANECDCSWLTKERAIKKLL